MSEILKKCIFFAGGKRIEPVADDNTSLIFKREASGDWKVSLEMEIPKNEAENVIRIFDDFNIEAANFEEKYANQIFFQALDDDGNFKKIELENIKISVFFDRDDDGSIVFSFLPSFTGKTQNAKTQNAGI